MLNLPANYYNRFDPTKGYKQLAFVAGAGIQSSELNEIQATILHELKSISNFLVTNGTIISGGEIAGIEPTFINIKEATVYADGLTHLVAERAVPILGAGVELVGVAVLQSLVTDLEDPELRCQVPESPNYGQPGASRIRESATWKVSTEVAEDEVFFPVITLKDGSIISSSSTTSDTSYMKDLIGQYDYDIRGSYILEGLTLTFKEVDSVTGEVVMYVSAGRARVLGTPVTNPFQVEIRLPSVSDLRLTESEPYLFTSTGDYTLRNTPVSDIVAVQGTKQVQRTITHGGFTGVSDNLPDTPVLSIVAVNQGGTWNGTTFTGGTTYAVNTDYTQSGDAINWSPGGAEPAPGSTYIIIYRYIDTFTAAVNNGLNGVTISVGDALVSGSTFYVDYHYFLSRIDRVSIDKTGKFVVSKGTPAQYNYTAPSSVASTLSLATIKLVKGVNPVITQDSVLNISLSQLADIQTRLAESEYNIARLSLLENARSTDPTTNKRNLVVDAFQDNDMRDYGESNNGIITSRTLTIGSNLSQIGSINSFKFLPVSSSDVVVNQPYQTKSIKINPYAASNDPLTGRLVSAPASIQFTRWWWMTQAMVDAQSVTFSFSQFNNGETVVINFLGSNQSVVASSTGSGSATFVIPSGTGQGSYVSRATGQTSGAVALSTVSINQVTVFPPARRDPVAQTFVVTEERDLSAVSFKLTELPTDNEVGVKIVGVVLGIPDKDDVLATGRVLRANAVIGWNTVTLDRPVFASPDREYAIIITTGRPVGSVATAKVGQYDSLNFKWMSSQPIDGVLLVSANESTWTPIQDEDLTFKLMGSVYQPSSTITLMTLTGLSNITDWLLSGDLFMPPDTSLSLFLETGAGVRYDMQVGAPLFTSAISGTVYIKAILTTNNVKRSPVIDADLVLMAGTANKPGNYNQRAFTITNGVSSPATIKLLLEEFKPTGTSITPSIETDASTYTNMTFSSSTPIGDGWTESVYTISGVAVNTSSLRIILDTTDTKVRPSARNIRLLIS